jgi:FMN phosphatase YigB (HAD superfamily)
MGHILNALPEAVIFDVDGTLYDQPRLRRIMCRELALHFIRSPVNGLGTIKTLAVFRRIRERMPSMEITNLAQATYTMTAQRLNYPLDQVRQIVHEWMFQRPLRHLPSCKFPGLDSFLDYLTMRGVATAVFSDYPAQAKTQSMGLKFSLLLDAEDERVDRLKPDPKGLIVCSELLGLDTAECLFVGDRDDRDGECARRAGTPFLLFRASPSYTRDCIRSYQALLEFFECLP